MEIRNDGIFNVCMSIGLAARMLKSYGMDLKTARDAASAVLGPGQDEVGTEIPFTPRAKKVLDNANRQAAALGHGYIGTEHLLLALLEEEGGVALRVFESAKIDRARARQEMLEAVSDAGQADGDKRLGEGGVGEWPATIGGVSPCPPRAARHHAQARARMSGVVHATHRGGENEEEAKFGMAKFGTTEVCQIMPWYLKVRSHFSRCRFELSWHAQWKQSLGSKSNPPSHHLEAVGNNSNQPKARRRQPPTIHSLRLLLYHNPGICTKFCSGTSELVANFLCTKFAIPNFARF